MPDKNLTQRLQIWQDFLADPYQSLSKGGVLANNCKPQQP